MRRLRVLVVDDHQMLREALVGMLEAGGFEVVGAVADGADATSLAVELTPDVVLLDLSIPVLNGLDALMSIVQMPKGVPVGTQAIGKPGAANAALHAASILALKYPELRARLASWRQARTDEVLREREIS